MQTSLDPRFQQTRDGGIVESILRKCVHCGFCNATCPTYQLLGDELDGPRGRIYQMKQFFEGAAANTEMLKHLDRCLTCRACETTCPSGVNYSQLLEIGRAAIEQELPRPWLDRMRRRALVRLFTSAWQFKLMLAIGQRLKWMLPARIRRAIPARQVPLPRAGGRHARKVLMLAGCVQPTLTPNTNSSAINLFDKLGIEVIELSGNSCCGAVALHTSDSDYGLRQVKQLIDRWWPYIESGVEAIVITASGCGVNVKDYARLLADDADYAHKAKTVSSLYRDLVEVVEAEGTRPNLDKADRKRIAVHTPCTLQHGLGLDQRIENLLASAGYEICRVEDAHLCCGSAGTYSLLQPAIAEQLQQNKINALTLDAPDIIATANVGCQLQLSRGNQVPVVHWVELL